MRSKIVIQKPTDTSVGLIGVDSLLEVYDNTKSGDLVVVYPGTYDLGANGIKLKDGVNFLFMPGVVINSTNPSGAFYDDGVEVHCTIQGSPKIINGAGAAINLTNQSSSCPLNNKNLTVQNLPDPMLFNEGDIVTLEGGATYKHNGTTWKPLVDEYDFYYTIDTIQNATAEIMASDKNVVSIFIDFSNQTAPVHFNGGIFGGTKKLNVFIKSNMHVLIYDGIIASQVNINFPSGWLSLKSPNKSFTDQEQYTVSYHHELTTLSSAVVGQKALITSQGGLLYKLIASDYTDLNNWELQTTINMAVQVDGEVIFPKHLFKDFEEDDAEAFVESSFQDKLTPGDVVMGYVDDVYVFQYLGSNSWRELNNGNSIRVVEMGVTSNSKSLNLGVVFLGINKTFLGELTLDGYFVLQIKECTFGRGSFGKIFGVLTVDESIILAGSVGNRPHSTNALYPETATIKGSVVPLISLSLAENLKITFSKMTGTPYFSKYEFLKSMEENPAFL
ncbi:MAG: hypothetical protein RBR74_12935, partial [Ignavibacteriaceae bacterium]|nr:hypothetical protein [Ignavibacteriaceae bacterium]